MSYLCVINDINFLNVVPYSLIISTVKDQDGVYARDGLSTTPKTKFKCPREAAKRDGGTSPTLPSARPAETLYNTCGAEKCLNAHISAHIFPPSSCPISAILRKGLACCVYDARILYYNETKFLMRVLSVGSALLLEKEIALAPSYFPEAARLLVHAEMGQLCKLLPD